jgi:hypothetical protein
MNQMNITRQEIEARNYDLKAIDPNTKLWLVSPATSRAGLFWANWRDRMTAISFSGKESLKGENDESTPSAAMGNCHNFSDASPGWM